jgi:prolyl oligopeptidase
MPAWAEPHGAARPIMSREHRMQAAISAILLLAASAALAQPVATPVTDTVHGITLTDEYRWMEDPARAADLGAWVQSESAKASAALQALPERAAFAEQLRLVSSGLTRVRNLQMAGPVSVFLRTADGDRTARLVVRTQGRERVLIDPNAAQGTVQAINNLALSPDGRQVAVHQAKGGGEVGEITIVDVASGRPVGTPIARVWGEFELQWLGKGWLTYTQMAPEGTRADPMTGMRAYLKRVGDPGPGEAVFGLGTPGPTFPEKDFPIVSGAPWSDWVLAAGVGARVDASYWVTRKAGLLAGRPTWLPLATLDDRVSAADVFGQAVFLWTTRANGAGAIVRRPLSAGGIGAPVTVFEGNDRLILTGVVVAKDGVYVGAQTDGVTRLFHSPDGQRKFSEVPLPIAAGDILDLRVRIDGGGLTLGLMGWLSNIHSYRVAGGRMHDTGLGSQTWAGAQQMQVDSLEATSADGTRVPLVVLRRKGPLPAGGMPTILDAYGSYGSSSATPVYRRDSMAWLARGGAMAYCGVRGGGERGRAWHEGGRSANKPNGHADFIACAATLKAAGIAPAKGVVATGTSAGGLLVPPAVMKEPGLFAAMVPRVAILNPTRLAASANGANQFDEMGDPATPEGFKALLAMDAYQMLATAPTLPDTLLTIGLNDKRVSPWMSAKFAARAQARFGAQRSIWLRAESDGGHGLGSAESARAAEFADIYAFAWDRSR